MNDNEIINKKIKEKPAWYFDDQQKTLKLKSYIYTIQKRYDFIKLAIEEFKKNNLNKNINVLDAGCGDGVNLNLLTSIPGLKIIGFDYNIVRIERSKNKFPDVDFFYGNLITFNFNDKFDIILCSQVLEHIKEDELILKKFYNILDDSGILILGVPNEGCFLAQLRNNYIQKSIRKTTDHVNFYTETSIAEKIIKSGFKIKKIMHSGFFFPHLRINSIIMSNILGIKLMEMLGKIFRSQVAGYYFILEKIK